jgi:L-ribulose-5-phosphate 3-epimerase
MSERETANMSQLKRGLSQIILGSQSLIADGVKLCREIGYEGFEILMTDGGELTPAAGEAEYREVRRIGDAVGIVYTSLCGGSRQGRSLTAESPADRELGISMHAKLLEAAAALGIDTVLTTGGRVTETVPYDVALQRLEEGLRALAPVAERTRVNLALENVWNKLLLSPLEARDLIDRIGSEYVGWYFDTGNVVIYGFPEQWIRILGPRIKKVHFKDFKRQGYQWTQLMDGDVDWPAVMRELRSIGYDDFVISEVDGGPEVFAETYRRMERILNL